MTIDKFLKTFVEDYLFHDLKAMDDIPQVPKGGCNYPMVVTIVAGMELLGGLLTTTTFRTHSGEKYFVNYWNNYLTKVNGKYRDFGSLLYALARHGIAHTFTPKSIRIAKTGQASSHLLIDKEGSLIVDARILYQDFKQSYEEGVLPIVNKTAVMASVTKEDMQNRLEQMEKEYTKQTEGLFTKFYQTPTGQQYKSVTVQSSIVANIPPDLTASFSFPSNPMIFKQIKEGEAE